MFPKIALVLAAAFVALSPSGFLAEVPAAGASAPAVVSARKFPAGGDADWSSTNRILFVEPNAGGVNQPFTMNPDGSDRRLIPTPNPARNTFNPAWHPNGQWFVAQRELDWHWLEWLRGVPLAKEGLLNGLWSDLYAAKADGSGWTKLTSTNPHATDGVLAPTFSRDGTQLMWSRLVAPQDSQHPWGVFRLMLGDFRIQNGTPSLTNVRDITPVVMKDRFVESHVFAPDGASVLVSSDLGTTSRWQMHIYRIDLATLTVTRISQVETWSEHATFTPDGQFIVYMTGIPGYLLTTDFVRVNLDGSGRTQLTRFNHVGSPEYAGEMVFASRIRFSPDGSQAVVTTQSLTRYPTRDLWVISFSNDGT